MAAGCLGGPAGAHTSAGPGTAGCNLSPRGERVADADDHAYCVSVSVALSAPPSVGATATLTFSVTVVRAGAVTITAELPPGMQWASVPAGFAASTEQSRAAHANGNLQLVSAVHTFRAAQRRTFTGTVRAVVAGPAEIHVRAAQGAGSGPLLADHLATMRSTSGADAVFLTLGTVSRFGIPVNTNAGTARYAGPKPTYPAPRNAAKPPSIRGLATPPPQRPTPTAGVRAASLTSCVTGTWNYSETGGTERPGVAWRVEAWDNDGGPGDDLLAVGATGWGGEYNLCFDSNDTDGFGSQDVYVRFIADSGAWRVQTSTGWIYNYVSGTLWNVTAGTTADVGWLQPGDPTHMRAAMAYSATQRTWNALPGACWDMVGACRSVVIVWQPDSTVGNHYSPGGNTVHLLATGPDSIDTVIHEVGHSVMDDVYDDSMPPAPNCSPHSVNKASSAGCAWVEGFADWLPTWVLGRTTSFGFELEAQTAATLGWDDGDQVEGRVAGALMDLIDTTNEDRDGVGEGIDNVWSTFQKHNSRTFLEFWNHRAADGFTVGNAALGALFQNSIDYGFQP